MNCRVTDKLCNNVTGISFILVSTWQKLPDLTSDQPLLLVMPGRCGQLLKKLGADPRKITEEELLLKDADDASLLRRRVTLLQVSNHELKAGGTMKKVDWHPAASVELI